MIKIGSLFSGIGGFELGLERAIPNSETIWQVEQDKFCQQVLKKHWPHAKIYNDVREISAENVEPVDLLCGGFPCQDISTSNSKGAGLNGKKSGLWWEMHRIIRSLRPRVVVLENVANILSKGGLEVVGALTESGYNCEWGIVSARQMGAPHLRRRWFCVAYSDSSPSGQMPNRQKQNKAREGHKSEVLHKKRETYAERTAEIDRLGSAAYSDKKPLQERIQPEPAQEREQSAQSDSQTDAAYSDSLRAQIQTEGRQPAEQMPRGKSQDGTFWQTWQAPSPVCRVDDGISNRLDRIRALGNAIVPQCSEYIGRLIHESGVLYE